MGKDKKKFAEDFGKSKAGVDPRVNPEPALETRLHQDLTLSKDEREKGASPAYAFGKKIEQKERKAK